MRNLLQAERAAAEEPDAPGVVATPAPHDIRQLLEQHPIASDYKLAASMYEDGTERKRHRACATARKNSSSAASGRALSIGGGEGTLHRSKAAEDQRGHANLRLRAAKA